MTSNGATTIHTTAEGKKLALGSGDEVLTYESLRGSGAREDQVKAGAEQWLVRGPHSYPHFGKTRYAFADGVIDGSLLKVTEQDPGGPVNGWVDMDTKAHRWMQPGIGDRWAYRVCASLDAGYSLWVPSYLHGKPLRSRLYRPGVPPCTVPDVQADIDFFLANIGRGKLYQGRDLDAAGLSLLVSSGSSKSQHETLAYPVVFFPRGWAAFGDEAFERNVLLFR